TVAFIAYERVMNCAESVCDPTPATYPKNYSYKNVVNSFLMNGSRVRGQASEASSLPSGGPSDSISSGTSQSQSTPADLSPSFTLNPGDVKMVHHLRNGGKLVIQKKKNGDVAYALNCPDGRKVFLEKTKENAVLSLTDAQGHSIKTLACEF
ncbi:hypothetical protein V3C99_009150, partial [Haemonchus contortus]|uniref:BPL_C domain-containing protein n=1 Tax=Haemonchus contortus TaxID=6289 RepID=A0A7I4YIX0_HAECO